MAKYSFVLMKSWLESVVTYHPDEEVKDEANHLLDMFEKDKHRPHKKYIMDFINENKLETIKNKPTIVEPYK